MSESTPDGSVGGTATTTHPGDASPTPKKQKLSLCDNYASLESSDSLDSETSSEQQDQAIGPFSSSD